MRRPHWILIVRLCSAPMFLALLTAGSLFRAAPVHAKTDIHPRGQKLIQEFKVLTVNPPDAIIHAKLEPPTTTYTVDFDQEALAQFTAAMTKMVDEADEGKRGFVTPSIFFFYSWPKSYSQTQAKWKGDISCGVWDQGARSWTHPNGFLPGHCPHPNNVTSHPGTITADNRLIASIGGYIPEGTPFYVGASWNVHCVYSGSETGKENCELSFIGYTVGNGDAEEPEPAKQPITPDGGGNIHGRVDCTSDDADGLTCTVDGKSLVTQEKSVAGPGTSDGNGIPWTAYGIGVLVLGGGLFVLTKRFGNQWNFGANLAINDWKNDPSAIPDAQQQSSHCAEEREAAYEAWLTAKNLQQNYDRMEESVMQSRATTGNRASVKEENDLVRMQQALDEAVENEAKARTTYQVCMGKARTGPDPTVTPAKGTDHAPAQYAPPENPSPNDEDHEVM